jgi:AcrR family transcriptional regulator
MKSRRSYHSQRRTEAAAATRLRVLDAARALFSRRGVDAITVADIAKRARVAESTVYALYKSKVGILRALMTQALFGAKYRAAALRLEETDDPVALLRLTAGVARAIYESEATEIGLLRGSSALSPELRKLEREFEDARYELQRRRVELLFSRGAVRPGLTPDEARRVLWMYTSRDVYRMLVIEGGWTADAFESWLADTLAAALLGSIRSNGHAARQ